jgi:hypothetical protein
MAHSAVADQSNSTNSEVGQPSVQINKRLMRCRLGRCYVHRLPPVTQVVRRIRARVLSGGRWRAFGHSAQRARRKAAGGLSLGLGVARNPHCHVAMQR